MAASLLYAGHYRLVFMTYIYAVCLNVSTAVIKFLTAKEDVMNAKVNIYGKFWQNFHFETFVAGSIRPVTILST